MYTPGIHIDDAFAREVVYYESLKRELKDKTPSPNLFFFVPMHLCVCVLCTILVLVESFSPNMCTNLHPLGRKRSLPEREVIAGYASWDRSIIHKEGIPKILESVRSGVNVLFWFSIDLVKDAQTGQPAIVTRGPPPETMVTITEQLRVEGLEVSHLISIGGWNEVHPFTGAGAAEMYKAFKTWNENIMARPDQGFFGFDGLDWDIEGHDDKASQFNHFTAACLNVMGEMSILAKQDGYLVTMAPPESYLDPFTNGFSRSLRGTLPEWRHLVPHFTYHVGKYKSTNTDAAAGTRAQILTRWKAVQGMNCYSYLLAKYGKTSRASHAGQCAAVDTFDLVIYQLYESYSHANYHVEVSKGDASQFLVNLTRRMSEGWVVNFSEDEELGFADTLVRVAPHQLVIGLANAWAFDSHKNSVVPGVRKTVFLRASELQQAYTQLDVEGTQLRGFAFWSLLHEGDALDTSLLHDGEEGGEKKPFYMARELKALMSAS